MLYAGAANNDTLASAMQYFNTPIVTKGRIVVGIENKLNVFKP